MTGQAGQAAMRPEKSSRMTQYSQNMNHFIINEVERAYFSYLIDCLLCCLPIGITEPHMLFNQDESTYEKS
jgi:hypothetical protein